MTPAGRGGCTPTSTTCGQPSGGALDRDDSEAAALAVRTIVGLAWFAQSNRAISLDDMAMQAVDLVADGPPKWRSVIFALASQHELNRGQPERALEFSRESLQDGIVTEALYSFLPHQNAIFVELMVGARERAEMLLAEGDVGFANADPYTEGSYRVVAGDVPGAARPRRGGERRG